MSTRILLQTTIPFVEDDWHIGRFAMLAEHLERFEGGRRFSVTGRDRTPDATGHDPVLRDLSRHHFDQVWVFGVDGGGDTGLAPPEVEGLRRFHLAGGGLMLSRDHHDMGCALRHVAEVGPRNAGTQSHPRRTPPGTAMTTTTRPSAGRTTTRDRMAPIRPCGRLPTIPFSTAYGGCRARGRPPRTQGGTGDRSRQ